MNDAIKSLIKLEEEFNLIKSKTERKHIIFIILYFLPPLAAIFILNKYFQDYYNNITKGIIFGIIIIGVIIHYALRHIYHKSKNRYKKFIDNKLEEIKNSFDNDEDFKKNIIESARYIFIENGIKFSNKSISLSSFWSLVFLKLDLHIENDDQ